MNLINQTMLIIQLSYILQLLGFVLILAAWLRAFGEFRNGHDVPRTRKLLFIITSVTLSAYIVPTLLSVCYFTEGCFLPVYREYLRLFSGLILFLYGLFKFLLYYTKEVEHN